VAHGEVAYAFGFHILYHARRKFPVRAETELNLVIVGRQVRIVGPQGGTLLHLLEHIFEAKNGLGDYPRHKGSVVPQVVWSYNKL
jgi:hypothetical protein